MQKLSTLLSGIILNSILLFTVFNSFTVLIDPIMVLHAFPKETGLDETTITLFFEKHTVNDPYEADQFYKFTRVITQLKYIEKREKQLFLVEVPYYIFNESAGIPENHKSLAEKSNPEINANLIYYFNDPSIIVENIDTRKISKLIIKILCKTDEELDQLCNNSNDFYAIFPDNEVIGLKNITFEELSLEYAILKASLIKFQTNVNNKLLSNIFIENINNCEIYFDKIKDILNDLKINNHANVISKAKNLELSKRQELANLILMTFNRLMELNILKRIIENSSNTHITLISGYIHSYSIYMILSKLGGITNLITNQENNFISSKSPLFWPNITLEQFDKILEKTLKSRSSCILV